MTESGTMPGAGGPHGGSKGVAVTNWLVQKAAGLLEKKTSRRGFIMGSAMVGSAVAVAGCVPATTPGSPYTHITDCAGGLCTDGYTEFCCTINQGINACPPNSFWGGWWRADYSSFCNGTRYYIDCMQYCCGPKTGFQEFCAGCEECRCGGGCDSRRVYCNYFRYGQCHTDITSTGPIACRVVTCVPPYIADPACSTATLVDNSTAEHTSPCITTPRNLPNSGAMAFHPAYGTFLFHRAFSGNVGVRVFDGSSWSAYGEIAPSVNSGIAAVADADNVYVFGRGSDNLLWYNRFTAGAWQGAKSLPGIFCNADPAVCVDANGVQVFVRSIDNAIWWGTLVGDAWSSYTKLGGSVSSNPAVGASNDGLFCVVRGSDGQPWSNRRDAAGVWSGFQAMGGSMLGSPAACGTGGSFDVFVRGRDQRLYARTWEGGGWTTGSWVALGGYLIGDPYAVADASGPYVFSWGVDETVSYNHRTGGSWSPFRNTSGSGSAVVAGTSTPNGPFVFVRSFDNQPWTGAFISGNFTGWSARGGADICVTALA